MILKTLIIAVPYIFIYIGGEVADNGDWVGGLGIFFMALILCIQNQGTLDK